MEHLGNKPSEYNMVGLNRGAILDKIIRLAESYTPEWVPNLDDPDVGTTLAMLYADGMEDLIARHNETLDREYVQLINMLGVSLKKAYPAKGVVLLDVESDTAPGRRFPAGIRLTTEGDAAEVEDGQIASSEPIVFESVNPIYATSSRLTQIFTTDVETGIVNCKLGDITDEELANHYFIVCHENLFNTVSSRTYVKFEDGLDLLKLIKKGYVDISYYGEEETVTALTDYRLEEDGISFIPGGRIKKITIAGRKVSALIFTAKGPVKKDIKVGKIGITSHSEADIRPTIYNGSMELDAREFKPFSDKLMLYSEVYIGDRDYFNKPGAVVSIDFDLSFVDTVSELPKAEEVVNLAIIKRKPRKSVELSPAKVFAQEVSIDYFNGSGYVTLPIRSGFNTIFAADSGGHVTMQFKCPSDMAITEVGARECYSIRIRLNKADNCYYMPSIHHCPIIKNMTLSYTYDGKLSNPDIIVTKNYRDEVILNREQIFDGGYTVLSKLSAPESAVFLGFTKAFEDGPINLLVDVGDDKVSNYNDKLELEYFDGENFERIKFVDNTMGLTHTGTVCFMPPADMTRTTLFGEEHFWLKLLFRNIRTLEASPNAPEFDRILVNAIEVKNIHTYNENDYYTDEIKANMSFALAGTNILDADVWVNETGAHSDSAMRRMLAQDKNNARAEYDFRGNITRFFVKWTEVDSFDLSTASDRHYTIDRMNNRIFFGDGVGVMIPKVSNDVCFRVVLRSCDGEAANLGPNSITQSVNNLIFVDSISNPNRTYGGMNMETLEQAIVRGTGIINSRNRLISLGDYEREVFAFSSRVLSCKAIPGVRRDGTIEPGFIGIVVLVDDFEQSEASFVSIRERLLPHLLKRSEVSVTEKNLDVVEPIVVSVNVQIWATATGAGDTFEISSELTEVLDEFLSPNINRSLTIGSGLDKSRIELRLHMEKSKAWIKRVLATASYVDESGYHEVDLDDLPKNPYFLIKGGKHVIKFI